MNVLIYTADKTMSGHIVASLQKSQYRPILVIDLDQLVEMGNHTDICAIMLDSNLPTYRDALRKLNLVGISIKIPVVSILHRSDDANIFVYAQSQNAWFSCSKVFDNDKNLPSMLTGYVEAWASPISASWRTPI